MSESHSTEIFHDVLGFPGYRVSNRGRVQSCWKRGRYPSMLLTWHDMKLRTHSHGYHFVTLSRNGEEVRKYVHVLVLEAFTGPCPDDMECRHLNGNPSDNRWPENIVWGTFKENTADIFRHGRGMIGESHYASNLTDDDVREIRRLARDGITQQEIGQKFGLSPGGIGDIVRGVNWRHVGGALLPGESGKNLRGERRPFAKLTEEQAKEVYRRVCAGESQDTLAEEFGIARNTVSSIKHRKTWKNIHKG